MATREYFMNGGQGDPIASQARPELPLPDKDGRHYALTALAKYLSQIPFQMTGAVGGPLVTFHIPLKNIYTSWPDNEELLDKGDGDFPRVAFEGIDQTEDYQGFVAHEIPDTDDLYGPGTTLFLTSEHIETLQLNILCRSVAERRAVIAGLLVALNPVQDFLGLKFVLPDYFNATCRFILESGGRHEDPDAAANRRSIVLQLSFRVPTIVVSRVERLVPVVEQSVSADQVLDPNPIDPSVLPSG